MAGLSHPDEEMGTDRCKSGGGAIAKPSIIWMAALPSNGALKLNGSIVELAAYTR
jgi:hypothetical protein